MKRRPGRKGEKPVGRVCVAFGWRPTILGLEWSIGKSCLRVARQSRYRAPKYVRGIEVVDKERLREAVQAEDEACDETIARASLQRYTVEGL